MGDWDDDVQGANNTVSTFEHEVIDKRRKQIQNGQIILYMKYFLSHRLTCGIPQVGNFSLEVVTMAMRIAIVNFLMFFCLLLSKLLLFVYI